MTCQVGADHGVAGLEGLDLLEVVRPVLRDVLALVLQQRDGGVELLLVERVGVLDARGRAGCFIRYSAASAM